MSFICIDIGATKTLIGIGSKSFDKLKKVPTDYFLQHIKSEVQSFLQKKNIKTAAIATAGPIDLEKGEIYPPNLPQDKIQIREPLEELFEALTMLNDCAAGAIGEYTYGTFSSDNMVYITISSGIGGGVITDGKLLKGWNGNFAEIGHMKINDKMRCGCGEIGHWEACCSGKNLQYFCEEITEKSFDSAKSLFRAYRDGEKAALQAIKKMQELNSIALINIVNLYNPEIITIGGGMALSNPEIIIEPLQNSVKGHTINPLPDIKKASLGERSVIEGLRAICMLEYEL